MANYQFKIEDLTKKLSDLQKTFEKAREKYSKENEELMIRGQELELMIKKLQTEIIQKDSKIEDLESIVTSQENEIEILKQINANNAKSNEDSSQFVGQVELIAMKRKEVEDSLKARIDELTKENGELRMEISGYQNRLSAVRIDHDNEITKLAEENENLKKQNKELSAKLLAAKFDSKELVDLRNRIAQIDSIKKKLEGELVKAKV